MAMSAHDSGISPHSVPSSSTSPAALASFACSQCPKAFGRRENLSRHQKTHDLIKSHRCAICSKAFTRSDLLKRHIAVHSRENDSPSSDLESQRALKRQRTARVSSPARITRSRQEEVDGSQDGRLDPALVEGSSVQLHSLNDLEHVETLISHPWNETAGQPVDPQSILTPNLYIESADLDAWFSDDFFTALQETGCDWIDLEGAHFTDTSPFLPLISDNGNSGQYYAVSSGGTIPQPGREVSAEHQDELPGDRTSDISSPPNEPSEEDRWPFAWNPRSNPIMHADNSISIPRNHELFKKHDSKYDLSEATYHKVVRYVNFTNDHGLFAIHKSRITLPTLPVMNIFMGLFFKYFYPQMPVIHLVTLDINKDLPPVLLAVMFVIGAIYSHQKHTRRFSIVLLDLVRKALLMSIEYDNSLMRDPLIIYALTLVCHTGLWCGNKRAFELAEVIRGSVVSYCRRAGFGSDNKHELRASQRKETVNMDAISQWKLWIAGETQKRLCWAVYSLDCQFPSLLNLPATISRSEISGLGCPCDDEFWQAPSAWHWRRLLGPASVPPAVSFATAIGPFVVPPTITNTTQSHHNGQDEHTAVKLNAWSRYIVLFSIHVQIFELAQEMIVVERICGAGNFDHENAFEAENIGTHGLGGFRETNTLPNLGERESSFMNNLRDPFRPNMIDQIRERLQSSSNSQRWSIWTYLATTKTQLAASLSSWSKAYSQVPSYNSQAPPAPNFFKQSSDLLEKLGRVMLEVPLTDLQDAIGKSGPSKIPIAMSKLSLWIRSSTCSLDAALESVKIIDFLSPSKNNPLPVLRIREYTPYSIITFFICHITLWAFVTVADNTRQSELMHLIDGCEALNGTRISILFKGLLGNHHNDSSEEEDHILKSQKLLFRSAAEGLTRMGTWGCSLNLAMMLYKRAEM